MQAVWCNGYGFPRAKGGLLFFADHVGVPKVLAKLQELEKQYGADFKPAKLLEQMVRNGKKFADLPESKGINVEKVPTRVAARM